MKSNNKQFCGLLVLLLLTGICLFCVKNKFKRIQLRNTNSLSKVLRIMKLPY